MTDAQARRIALRAQGFTDTAPTGRVDVRHFRRVVRRTGVVQLDSVNVLARAHYMPFFSRLGPYDRGTLDRWLWNSGELFEYWGHGASLLPIDTRSLFAHRMNDDTHWGSIERLGRERPEFIEHILNEVRTRGPLTVSDLDTEEKRSDAWWGWRAEKLALEWLFFRGRLTVAGRPNFARLYDLPERVHPQALTWPAPAVEDARKELLLRAAKAHGIGTAADLADYYRMRVPTARPLLDRLVRSGRLRLAEVSGWSGTVYLHPDALLPRRTEGAALVGPFDPLVWFRPRVRRLFGFRYRIEIYVPAEKRQFGYYVLPFLLDGELVGRVDLKADRKRSVLMARSSYAEDGHDPMRIARAMAAELRSMAQWLELEDLEIDRKGNLAGLLRKQAQ
ncbi:MAG TPA: winged helix-turn-helix domain-containing protein [Actinobacteria bacterium]|nr:winged helix-turn-helix domain-containing protein [Actinomycetota bacterium]